MREREGEGREEGGVGERKEEGRGGSWRGGSEHCVIAITASS
jgi:hypothetical protein